MKAVDQTLINGPITLTTITCHFLARLLAAARAKTDLSKDQPVVLRLNVPQAKKYNLFEFTFGPEDKYEGELQKLFEEEFNDKAEAEIEPKDISKGEVKTEREVKGKSRDEAKSEAKPKDKARAVFDELQAMLPDGVKLISTSKAVSPFPRYEFEGRLALLSIYLAARHFIKDQPESESFQPFYKRTIASRLHKIWEKAAKQMEHLYEDELDSDETEDEHFKKVKKAVYAFQNRFRAELVTIICRQRVPEPKDLKLVATALSDYEQRTHLNIAPELAELEREFNCDIFRLSEVESKDKSKDEVKDTNGVFQFYRRHLPQTLIQKRKLELDSKGKETKSEPTASDRILYPTITAHSDGSSLPNFADVCEGTYQESKKIINIAFCSMRHGTPMRLQELIKKPTWSNEDKHISAYQVFLNYEQELSIIRARAIESLLLQYNASPKIKEKFPSLQNIQWFSVELSSQITAQVHQSLLTGPFDHQQNYKLFAQAFKLADQAYTQSKKIPLPPAVRLYLLSAISEILFVRNFYTHLISGHDDLVGLQSKLGNEENQFHACSIAQYAFDFAADKPGFIYFCTPLNLSGVAGLDSDIINTIRVALIEACLTYHTAFEKDDLLIPQFTPLIENYRTSRKNVAVAAKSYLYACESKQGTVTLNTLLKKSEAAEQKFLNNPEFQTLFETLDDRIQRGKPSTLSGIVLKVIFELFNNSKGIYSKDKYVGILAALFPFFTHFISLENKIAIGASGGCKSANDRWQRIALILTTIAKKGITRQLLGDLETILQEFGDDIASNLSGIQTALSADTVPKSRFTLLAFSKLSEQGFDKKFYKRYKVFEELAAHKRTDYPEGGPEWDKFISLCTPKNPSFHTWYQFRVSPTLKPVTDLFYAFCADDWLETETDFPEETEAEENLEEAPTGIPLSQTTVSSSRAQKYSTHAEILVQLNKAIPHYSAKGKPKVGKTEVEETDSLALDWLSQYLRKEIMLLTFKESAAGGESSVEEKSPDSKVSPVSRFLLQSKKYLKTSERLKKLCKDVTEDFLGITPLPRQYEILFKLMDECFQIMIADKRLKPPTLIQGIFGKAESKNFSPEEIKYSQLIRRLDLTDIPSSVTDLAGLIASQKTATQLNTDSAQIPMGALTEMSDHEEDRGSNLSPDYTMDYSKGYS